MNHNEDLAVIMNIISQVGGVQNLGPDQDFYDAGISSVTALPLLMELETQFAITLPDDRFVQARTASALQKIVAELKNS
jgi:acyl carrier protein